MATNKREGGGSGCCLHGVAAYSYREAAVAAVGATISLHLRCRRGCNCCPTTGCHANSAAAVAPLLSSSGSSGGSMAQQPAVGKAANTAATANTAPSQAVTPTLPLLLPLLGSTA